MYIISWRIFESFSLGCFMNLRQLIYEYKETKCEILIKACVFVKHMIELSFKSFLREILQLD